MSSIKFKKAFSIVELSVVIVIISLLLSTILVSRTLIDNAKVGNIYSDASNIIQGFGIFQDQSQCLPGECGTSYLSVQSFDAVYNSANVGAITTVPTGGCLPGAVLVLTGSVDSAIKRSCAFSQMQQQQYISGVNNNPSNRYSSLAGDNLPFASFSRSAAWDLRKSSTTAMAPRELSSNLIAPPTPASGAFVQPWIGSHALILRNAIRTSAAATISVNDDITSVSGATNVLPAVSPAMAYKVDVKFDDGKPLTGTIVSGFNNSVAAPVVTAGVAAPATGCYGSGVVAAGTFGTISGLEIYGKSTDSSATSGCIMAFRIG
jgi:prepilin-type N-terminal cleavage/methylation domain-containing protein